MKKTLFNLGVLLLFLVLTIIGCGTAKVQKEQSLDTDKTKITAEGYSTWEGIEEELRTIDSLYKKGIISQDEFYRIRRDLLDRVDTDKTKITAEGYSTWEGIEEELKSIDSLYKKGIISQDEFYRIRRGLLDRD